MRLKLLVKMLVADGGGICGVDVGQDGPESGSVSNERLKRVVSQELTRLVVK